MFSDVRLHMTNGFGETSSEKFQEGQDSTSEFIEEVSLDIQARTSL